ncbi:MAG: hypothetical protein KDJ35_08760 [Alphaproteobacteria bacterium]|nr:hypothetical protein [Alphaproteobacteria bacterium]
MPRPKKRYYALTAIACVAFIGLMTHQMKKEDDDLLEEFELLDFNNTEQFTDEHNLQSSDTIAVQTPDISP